MDLTDKKIRGKSSKYRLRDRRASTRYALMAVVIVVLGYLANYFLRAEKFNIKSVLVQGVANISTRELEARIMRTLEGRYMGLLPKQNKFIYPRAKIKKDLIEAYPRIAELVLRVQEDSLLVGIIEYAEDVKWCQSIDDSLQCYFLTPEGRIFANSATTTGSGFYIYNTELRSIPAQGSPMDSYVIDREGLELIKEVIGELGTLGLTVRLVDLLENEETRVELRAGWYIVYKNSVPINLMINNLSIALGSDTIKNSIAELEYIDMRFGSKLYYKFKN